MQNKISGIFENQITDPKKVAFRTYTRSIGEKNCDQNIKTNSDNRYKSKSQRRNKKVRLNEIKQYSGTLSYTTVDKNTNSSDISEFRNTFNNSEVSNHDTFYPGSHTNSITSNLNQKLI